MPKRLLQALAVLLVASSPLAAETLSIDHSAVGCVVAGKFPALQARFVPGDAVAKARVFFTTADAKRWYSVAMKPDGGIHDERRRRSGSVQGQDDGGAWPRPR